MKCPLLCVIFLKRSLVFNILLFSSISLHCSLRKAFLFLVAILCDSVFRWVYLYFSPLPSISLLNDPDNQDLNHPDNCNGGVTRLEPDILECEVKWALGSITKNKASGGDGIPAKLFKTLK